MNIGNAPLLPNCPFCASSPLGERVTNRQILFGTRYWKVLFDHKPLTKGHLIVVPNEHRDTRFDLTAEECENLHEVQLRIKDVFQHVFGYCSNLQYEKNGLGIPHFQIHILPTSSKLHLLWLQIKLFIRTFPFPLWSLSDQRIEQLRREFTPPAEGIQF
ncbi:hypothetical protein PNK_0510 [Candidatus Protochlamydia naegleriophila]|uniref:HIT domain-containing protein n=1 Tax=Candidatus Protochlamydia naegleriophila TaxID=389348 RepID=A0A0U5JBE6_9BACT|nr:HIT domain-containing protein [Candidatus Protochlamydia naegleriophila]CUI16138.1 hypothetical protein PNK_0510 [Candidatus Protochlamydia naegleriophila]